MTDAPDKHDPRKGTWKLEVEKFDIWKKLDRQDGRVSDWREKLVAELGITGNITTVPPGWEMVLRCLFLELVKLGWDRHVASTQTYFGGLRVRLGTAATDAQLLACRRALGWSYSTCYRCGSSEAALHYRGAMVETTCLPCHDILTQEDPDGRQEPR